MQYHKILPQNRPWESILLWVFSAACPMTKNHALYLFVGDAALVASLWYIDMVYRHLVLSSLA